MFVSSVDAFLEVTRIIWKIRIAEKTSGRLLLNKFACSCIYFDMEKALVRAEVRLLLIVRVHRHVCVCCVHMSELAEFVGQHLETSPHFSHLSPPHPPHYYTK